MKIYRHYEELSAVPPTPRLVVVGNFDGVHLGHQQLISQARQLAAQSGLSLALCTFSPHPLRFFRPDTAPLNLTDTAHRVELFSALGVSEVLVQRFDRDMARMPAFDFARRVLRDALGAVHVLVGRNFQFGHQRSGTVAHLHEWGAGLGFAVSSLELRAQDDAVISSSRIRALLLEGDMRRAAALLGRDYEVRGKVVPGKKAASQLGFPTINIDTADYLIPRFGVYAARTYLPDQRVVPSVAYIGNRPTMGLGKTAEAHLLDFNEDLYDASVRLQFTCRMRDDIHFHSTEALRRQIAIDVDAVTKQMRCPDGR
ncbi:MAG: riboflavin biosynthesis protein RibF [Myxococcales bacterium]|jgi:riboflavin kinase/FMN adenylyltransferase|nr:riboflavin biosynthesis protein RibF [Myxococcales bacterium]